MVGDRCHLGVDVAFGQKPRMPPGDQRQPLRVEQRLQGLGVARELAAELDARVTVFGGLGEAGFERDVAAQLFENVIGPGQRCHAKADTVGKVCFGHGGPHGCQSGVSFIG